MNRQPRVTPRTRLESRIAERELYQVASGHMVSKPRALLSDYGGTTHR